jgi:hypothetical protein
MKLHIKAKVAYNDFNTPSPSQDPLLEKASPELHSHPMWSEADYRYLSGKGYSDAEIRELWDRDFKDGKEPVNKGIVPDVVGLTSDPNFYRKQR